MKLLNKYVVLDVHKDTTVIAVAEDGRSGEQRLYGTISNDRMIWKKRCASWGRGHHLARGLRSGPGGLSRVLPTAAVENQQYRRGAFEVTSAQTRTLMSSC